jgi:hypothetical protein
MAVIASALPRMRHSIRHPVALRTGSSSTMPDAATPRTFGMSSTPSCGWLSSIHRPFKDVPHELTNDYGFQVFVRAEWARMSCPNDVETVRLVF